MEGVFDFFPAHFFIEMCYTKEPRFGVIYERNQTFEDAELIRESYGIFRGCHEMAEQIKKLVSVDGVKTGMSFQVGEPNCCFADKIVIQIVDGNYCAYNAKSILSQTSGKFNPLHMVIGTRTVSDTNLVGAIMHELMHAYEDWMRRRNKTETLKGMMGKIGYKKINLDSKESIDLVFSHLFYFLNEFERNAYISQIDGLFRNCNEVFFTIGDAMNWVMKQFPYQHYEKLFSICETLYKEEDKEKQKIYLKTANDHSEYNFKTYDQLKHWLKTKLIEYKKKFEEIIPKIAMRYLELFESLYNPMVTCKQDVSLFD